MNEISEYSAQDRMILADVNILALQLMQKHGLIEEGWFFNFDRAKNRLGLCSHSNKIISMSKYLTTQRTYDQNRNTILHEIAHALVGSGHGHDARWELQALEIGCDGQRCGAIDEDAERPEHRWVAKCPSCKAVRHGFHRAPNCVRWCTACSPEFHFNYVLDWYQHGELMSHYEITPRYAEEYLKASYV